MEEGLLFSKDQTPQRIAKSVTNAERPHTTSSSSAAATIVAARAASIGAGLGRSGRVFVCSFSASSNRRFTKSIRQQKGESENERGQTKC